MAEKTTNKERLKEITDSIEANIQDLFQSERYMAYLRTMSRFHRYSLNNVILIHSQRPNATLVAGFNKWRDQFERNVMRGEKGIKIIAPTPFKKKIQEEKLDPDTNLPMRDKDGNIVTEEKEVKIPMFKVVSVFDVSQTEGKPLPDIVGTLTSDVQNYEVFMEALRRSSPVPITMGFLPPDTDGIFSSDQQSITIREGMSEAQTVAAVIHEITHSKLHNYEQKRLAGREAPQPKDRNTEEVEAESVSFAVCAYYGIDTGENSFGYIATWSQNKELPELRASLETINKTASELIDDIDRHYADICKERGIEQKITEYETVLIPPSYEQAYSFATEYVNCLMDADPHFVYGTEKTIAEAAARQIVNSNTAEIRAKLNNLAYEDDDGIYAPAEYLLRQLDRLYTKEYRVKETEPETATELLYTIDNNKYLHVQRCDGGVDYTLYDMATKRELDGGQLDISNIRLSAAALEICKLHNIGADAPARLTDIGILDELQEAQFEKPAAPNPHYEELVEHFAREDDALWNTDPSPMPDPAITVEDMCAYGYMDGDTMLPLSKERARELFEQDVPVFMLYGDSTEGMALDMEDIEKHDGIFGVEREEWENLRGTLAEQPKAEIPYRQAEQRRETENYLKNAEIATEDDYSMIDGIINNGPKQPTVAELEEQAKSGQPISLMDLAGAVHRENAEKKPSVLAQLKSAEQQTEKSHRSAPRKSAEREL